MLEIVRRLEVVMSSTRAGHDMYIMMLAEFELLAFFN